ncbi:MAG: TonB-dependent receptor [Aureispira sp.]|nr:TonB-dependent receptor [Aureispira sp.]
MPQHRLYYILLVFITISFPFATFALNNNDDKYQTIRGRVIDKYSKAPIENAAVELLNYLPRKVALTDEKGKFTIEGVPYGRHKLLAKVDGYEDLVINGLEVTAGKEVILVLQLEEKVQINIILPESTEKESTEKEVVLSTKDVPNNELAISAVRKLSVTELNRFTGDRQDPSRLVSNYAGIYIPSDYSNDVLVRGNSPMATQWRLEGIPIATPSHMASFLGTGGQTNMINLYVLDDSDVFLGAYPAEYTGAIAGIFDMQLRSGNDRRFGFAAQYSSVTGAMVTLEGPLTKNENGSFFINYRYSVFNYLYYGIDQLLNRPYFAADPGTAPRFQDLTFKIDLPSSAAGEFSIFGLGGLTNRALDGTDTIVAIRNLDVNLHQNQAHNARYGVVGLKHQIGIGPEKNAYWRTVLGVNYHQVADVKDLLEPDSLAKPVQDQNDQQYTIALSSIIHKKFSPKVSLRGGLLAEYTSLNLNQKFYNNNQELSTSNNFKGNSTALQGHMQLLYKPIQSLIFNVGLNGNIFLIGDKYHNYNVEPRAAVEWHFLPRHSFSLAFGMHSQQLPLQVYHNQDPTTNLYAVNANVGQVKGLHYMFGYNWLIADNWRLKLEGYYEDFYNVAIDSASPSFSLLNYGNEFSDFYPVNLNNLESKGKGRNYGGELTIEKFFSEGYYGLLAVSYQQATYLGADNIERPTAFGNGLTAQLVAGKEFKIGREKLNRISLDMKVAYSNGRHTLPIDTLSSILFQQSVYDNSNGFSEKLPDYFRVDFKIGFLFNSKKAKLNHRLYFDFLNVLNWRNIAGRYFDKFLNTIRTRTQLPLYVDILYQIRF